MPKFEEKESFQHKYAKELLHSWLTEKWRSVDGDTNNTIDFIDEKTGKDIGLCAYQADFVFMEYPITTAFPLLIDEQLGACALCPYKKSCEKYEEYKSYNHTFLGSLDSCLFAKEITCKYRSMEKYCPCLHCLAFDKSKIEYVVDIAIEHKGCISAVIEIVHKNSTPILKQQRLKECYTAFEIEARHIMGQIKKPSKLFVRSF
jgi:hypothetical protein